MYQIGCYIIFLINLFVLNTYAGPVPSFIKPCKSYDDECIISNAHRAIPYFAAGIPELKLPSLDPIVIDSVRSDDVNLKLGFRNIKITGVTKCKILELFRNTMNSTMKLVAECPLVGVGQYDLHGKVLFFEAFGNGDFKMHSDKIKIAVEIQIKDIIKDGQKYWKVTSFDYSYELLEKVFIVLQNLFDGDKKRAKPFEEVLDHSWKVLIEELGGPLIKQVISRYVDVIKKFFLSIPSDQLEIA